MSISVTTSKLVSLLLISLLTITRSSDRSDTIRQLVSPLTLVNDSSSALASPAEIVMSQLAGATSSMIQSPQPNESVFSTASRCFMETFEDNRRSIFDFNSFTPYIVILVAGLSFFFFNPSLIVKFIVLKQVLPTLACSIAPMWWSNLMHLANTNTSVIVSHTTQLPVQIINNMSDFVGPQNQDVWRYSV